MLYNTGTFVVQSGAGGKTQTSPFGALKSCAAKMVGGENQTYYLGLAADGILKGIDVVNMKHLFRFGSEQGSDLTIVEGTDEYTVPDGTFAIHEVQLIDAEDKVYRTLEYVPWGQFNTLENPQTAEGVPEFWVSRNGFDDRNIRIYPEPNDIAASKYTLRITSYMRIARPTLDTDIIDAPRELGEILCTYAEYYITRLRNKNNPTLYLERKRAFDEQLADYVHSTEREPTETLQWVLAPTTNFSGQFDPLR